MHVMHVLKRHLDAAPLFCGKTYSLQDDTERAFHRNQPLCKWHPGPSAHSGKTDSPDPTIYLEEMCEYSDKILYSRSQATALMELTGQRTSVEVQCQGAMQESADESC